MQLTLVNFPLTTDPQSGLNSLLATAAGQQAQGLLEGETADGGEVTIIVAVAPQGTQSMAGITDIGAGFYLMTIEASAAREAAQAQACFVKRTLNTSTSIDIDCPNGDKVVIESFAFSDGYVFDEIAAVQGDQG